MSRDVRWCEVMPCHVTHCHVICCDVRWDALPKDDVMCCHVMRCEALSFAVISCHVMWSDVIWRHVVWWDVVVWCGELGDGVSLGCETQHEYGPKHLRSPWLGTCNLPGDTVGAKPFIQAPFHCAMHPWDNMTTEGPRHSKSLDHSFCNPVRCKRQKIRCLDCCDGSVGQSLNQARIVWIRSYGHLVDCSLWSLGRSSGAG